MLYLFFIFNVFSTGEWESVRPAAHTPHMLKPCSLDVDFYSEKQLEVNNNKDEPGTYLTIHCKLPGNALNLIPANFSWKPFDLGGKVGIGHKRKLKQIFIKIYVHTKDSHPQQRHSVCRGNCRKVSKLNNIFTLEDRMKRWALLVRKRKWNMTGLAGDHNANSLQYFLLNKQEITISPQKHWAHLTPSVSPHSIETYTGQTSNMSRAL